MGSVEPVARKTVRRQRINTTADVTIWY